MSSVLEKAEVRYPFPGLRPFREGEEHLFFGRECQTDAMIDKLAATRFLTVIGTSGSGKSSLVNCGLCLGLHSGLMPEAGTKWRTATCRPGDNPIASLARALAQKGVLFDEYTAQGMSLSDIIETNLRMSKMGLIDAYEQARLSENTNLLIIIDQFEELFRFRRLSETDSATAEQSRDEATAFVKLLLSVTERTNKRVYVVLTMRSDFLGDCTQFEGLAEAINQGQYLVPRMTREQRRLAITGPIGVAGGRIEDVLLTRLINDPGDNPDQLSILQHALNRIWAHWSANNEAGQPLGMQNYNAIGSMSHALDRHAEKAFAELQSPRQRQLAEYLFKALTDKTHNIEGIRRPTTLQTICDLAQCTQDEMIQIIDVFRKPSRSFLMPPITDKLSADTVIDISHESLMRMWQRLVTWSEEEAVSTQTYRRLAATAELHEDNKAGLWRDPDLQLALQWRQRNNPNAIWASRIAPGFDQAMRFLDASRVKSDNEKEEQLRVAEQSRELEHARAIAYEQEQRMLAQRSAGKRQRNFFISVIAGLAATIGLGGVAFWQIQAQKTKLDEEQRRLTMHAENNKIINQQIWQLVKSNYRSGDQVTVKQTFVNPSDRNYQIFRLSMSQGLQSEPVFLASGASVVLDGMVNQIWIARVLPESTVTETGVWHEGAEPHTLQ